MKHLRILAFLTAAAGSAAIEFGALAPVLMMTSFGVYEFGRWAWSLEALQEAASRGARCAAIGQAACESSGAFSASSTASYVQTVAAGWGLTVPAGDITATNGTTCGGVSGFSQVQINYVFASVVNKIIPTGSAGKTLTLTSCYPDTPAG
ncbi:MAG TPA: TadE/TadG family type IV pilus assembly protein [Rhizomicrobium sp.]|jgi:Flp pilus assembly protein TadG|nr:TadE/TadG family type IV pilus assembly protein [Rhizomicrobium sp.]